MFSWGWSTQQSLILSILTSHRSALIIVHYRNKHLTKPVTICKYRPKYLVCSLSPKLFSKMFVILYFCQQCRRLWVVANSCYGQYLQSETLWQMCSSKCVPSASDNWCWASFLVISCHHIFGDVFVQVFCPFFELLSYCVLRDFFLVVTVFFLFLSVDWFVFETGFSM